MVGDSGELRAHQAAFLATEWAKLAEERLRGLTAAIALVGILGGAYLMMRSIVSIVFALMIAVTTIAFAAAAYIVGRMVIRRYIQQRFGVIEVPRVRRQ
jgi:hypothetical protein